MPPMDKSIFRPQQRPELPNDQDFTPFGGFWQGPGAMVRSSFDLTMQVYHKGTFTLPTLTPALSPGRGGRADPHPAFGRPLP